MTKKESSTALPEPSPVEHGGRVELRLSADAVTDEKVIYDARWFTANQELEGKVSINLAEKKGITVEAPDSLPDWLSTFTSTLVSTTARQAKKDGSWPRRLTRWRDHSAKK